MNITNSCVYHDLNHQLFGSPSPSPSFFHNPTLNFIKTQKNTQVFTQLGKITNATRLRSTVGKQEKKSTLHLVRNIKKKRN